LNDLKNIGEGSFKPFRQPPLKPDFIEQNYIYLLKLIPLCKSFY